ncbi:DUF881 domain-containing protein [Rhodococcus sp. Eu-32]|uniref:DUF881 domain-containing protein n=1 Tax=Rhodococcoides kyotonense TaxID=398843 RepID=A0A177Y761_9NOCA|nr:MULTISPECIES: DUF881 domain-containing protein [Rhodococcus]OAK51346.1 hypothetical protein A3K89_12125 [Rhodococcus kyotonensis]RRQ27256.1 DUF881 domain-containing protein [Rhodococcus sp. Eu-32]
MRRPAQRNPQSSLLRSLTSEHLDPGYAAASESRHAKNNRSRRSAATWTIAGTLAVGAVFGVAVGRTALDPSDAPGVGRDALGAAREASHRADELDAQRAELVVAVDEARREALQSDDAGNDVLGSLQSVADAAGTTPVTGPGISVVVSEPPAAATLSDASTRPRGSSAATVLDRDLQVVVNSLWASGAEAVAVGGIRIGPGVTIRQAGGAMLVDNRPVPSPYTVSAIGSPTQLQARFSVSDAYLRMSALSQLYRVGFDVRAESEIDLPAAASRPIALAHQDGPR